VTASRVDEAARVEHLGYRYGTRRALEDVTVSVRVGEAVAVLGPNGAGKSTLIANMLGLVQPTEGAARVLGMAPQAAARAGLVAGMLQGGTLPQFATVSEVLSYVSRLYPHPVSVAQAAGEAGVADLLHRSVTRLSGGQQRRVQFAMALLADAPFLFLDEPTEGMDIEGRADLWRIIRQPSSPHRPRTILFTTHDLSEADRYADRIVLLAKGRVVAADTPAALKARLATRRIRFQAPPGFAAEILARQTGLPITADGDAWEVATADSDAALRALLTVDVGLWDFRIVDGGLEEVFASLAGAEGGQSRVASRV
jgi:ABC-2 type transport system ATP-binding protein